MIKLIEPALRGEPFDLPDRFFSDNIGMPNLFLNRPSDVPTRETLHFLISHISAGAEILEVGCGDGGVARELLNRGYHVTGLDADPEAIAKAQARGVPTVFGSWPASDLGVSPDAIVFTRSLHHINPLTEAIARASELLNPKGLLLIEDFAFEEVDERTVNWFVSVLRSKQAKALIHPIADQLATDLLAAADVMQTWQDNHGRNLHAFETMTKAVVQRFGIRENLSVPYLYRYLVPVLADTPEAISFIDAIFREETVLGGREEIVLVGRRIVASAISKGRNF